MLLYTPVFGFSFFALGWPAPPSGFCPLFDKLRLRLPSYSTRYPGIVTGKDSFRQNAAVARIISLCKGARRHCMVTPISEPFRSPKT